MTSKFYWKRFILIGHHDFLRIPNVRHVQPNSPWESKMCICSLPFLGDVKSAQNPSTTSCVFKIPQLVPKLYFICILEEHFVFPWQNIWILYDYTEEVNNQRLSYRNACVSLSTFGFHLLSCSGEGHDATKWMWWPQCDCHCHMQQWPLHPNYVWKSNK